MIIFDRSKLSIEIVQLKSVTQALGGSIQIIDPLLSSPQKEITKRISVPHAVARHFIMKHSKITKYLKPVLTAITKYDGRVISMERHPMGAMGELTTIGVDGEVVTWNPHSQHNLDRLIYPLLHNSQKTWYFDGRYVYSFESNNIIDNVVKGQKISSDGCFRQITATAIDFQYLSSSDKLQPQERSCVAFIDNNQNYSISPPIWKNATSIRSSNDDDSFVSSGSLSIDNINDVMAVNLNFALRAGKEIGSIFGYECIEPLQLPRLMVELHTVNLPSIPNEVKSTYDIGIPFAHILAWLLGILKRADNLSTYVMIRSLLKHLTKRGIFRNDDFNASRVFQEGYTAADIEPQPLSDLIHSIAHDITRQVTTSISLPKKQNTQFLLSGTISE